jgi:probable rRNA maturation factor
MTLAQLDLSLQFGQLPDALLHRAALARHKVRRWIRHALQVDGEITVRIVGEEEGRHLNREFRKKDYATNVLTFDYARSPVVCADLVLCAPVVQREALDQGKSLQAHYAHLVVHGTLHAQGWDHETSRSDARLMEAREAELMSALGFDNPYQVTN